MNDPGFSSYDVCRMASVTFRQLDYWTRTGLVTPTVRQATTSGHRRRWSLRDVMLITALGSCAPAQRQRIAAAMAERPEARYLVMNEVTGDVYACESDADLLAAFAKATPIASVVPLDALVNHARAAARRVHAESSL